MAVPSGEASGCRPRHSGPTGRDSATR
jgi:hypothetical protein